MLHIVLVEPEIPPNTGNIGRLCVGTGSRLHLVEPLGFSLDDKSVRRAGLDYWSDLDLQRWPSIDAYLTALNQERARFHLLSTKASRSHTEAQFQDGDHLIFGRETRGLPESLLHQYPDHTLRLPMLPAIRSYNLATAVAGVLFEAVRQTGLCAATA